MIGVTNIWKKTLLGTLIMICLLGEIMAQETPVRDRVQTLKIAYITRTLSLTTAEAEKFWPVYNAYSDEMEALKKESRQLQRGIRGKVLSMSDKELEKTLDSFMENKKQELEISLKYHDKFKGVLPVRKVMLLYKAENDFGKKILEEWRERQQNRRNNNEED
ncbi:MAG: hypothetical protein AAGC85_03205 [Bacteroidota bacterium]